MAKTTKNAVGRRVGPRNTRDGKYPFPISMSADVERLAKRLLKENPRYDSVSSVFRHAIEMLNADLVMNRRNTGHAETVEGHRYLALLSVYAEIVRERCNILRRVGIFPDPHRKSVESFLGESDRIEYNSKIFDDDVVWSQLISRLKPLLKARDAEFTHELNTFVRNSVIMFELLGSWHFKTASLPRDTKLEIANTLMLSLAILIADGRPDIKLPIDTDIFFR